MYMVEIGSNALQANEREVTWNGLVSSKFRSKPDKNSKKGLWKLAV
jgi:hypothetical protein